MLGEMEFNICHSSQLSVVFTFHYYYYYSTIHLIIIMNLVLFPKMRLPLSVSRGTRSSSPTVKWVDPSPRVPRTSSVTDPDPLFGSMITAPSRQVEGSPRNTRAEPEAQDTPYICIYYPASTHSIPCPILRTCAGTARGERARGRPGEMKRGCSDTAGCLGYITTDVVI